MSIEEQLEQINKTLTAILELIRPDKEDGAHAVIFTSMGGNAVNKPTNTSSTPSFNNGYNKIQCIKIVRNFTSFALRESKEAVENLPHRFIGMTRESANDFAHQIEAAGGSATVCKEHCNDCRERFSCLTGEIKVVHV